MQEFFKYELHTLLDLLAIETSNYTKLIAAGITSGPDYMQAKMQINILQEVIFQKTKKDSTKAA